MGLYTMPTKNDNSYTSLHHFTKSPIDRGWMLGVCNFKRTKDFITGKLIPQFGTIFIKFDNVNHTPAKCLFIETYLTAIRNKKRCAKYIDTFIKEGLPLDISFDGEFKTYRLGK